MNLRRIVPFIIGFNFFVAAVSTQPCRAQTLVKGTGEQRLELQRRESRQNAFFETYAISDYQNLDSLDRDYILPNVIVMSLDPEAKLTREQKINLQQVLAVYYETMPFNVRASIEQRVLWMVFMRDEPAFTRKVIGQFLSPYTDIRSQQLCTLAADAAYLVTSDGEKHTIRSLMGLKSGQLNLLATLINSNEQIGTEKCSLGDGDVTPLSLKEMRIELIKAGLVSDTMNTPRKEKRTSARPLKPCQLSTIKSIFEDAIDSIQATGSKTRVYLGVHAMECPIYGLVVRDEDETFRYYPDHYREDLIPPVRFKTSDEIVRLFRSVRNHKATAPVDPASPQTVTKP